MSDDDTAWRKGERSAECPNCGEVFIPSSHGARYCSSECKAEYRKENRKTVDIPRLLLQDTDFGFEFTAWSQDDEVMEWIDFNGGFDPWSEPQPGTPEPLRRLAENVGGAPLFIFKPFWGGTKAELCDSPPENRPVFVAVHPETRLKETEEGPTHLLDMPQRISNSPGAKLYHVEFDPDDHLIFEWNDEEFIVTPFPEPSIEDQVLEVDAPGESPVFVTGHEPTVHVPNAVGRWKVEVNATADRASRWERPVIPGPPDGNRVTVDLSGAEPGPYRATAYTEQGEELGAVDFQYVPFLDALEVNQYDPLPDDGGHVPIRIEVRHTDGARIATGGQTTGQAETQDEQTIVGIPEEHTRATVEVQMRAPTGAATATASLRLPRVYWQLVEEGESPEPDGWSVDPVSLSEDDLEPTREDRIVVRLPREITSEKPVLSLGLSKARKVKTNRHGHLEILTRTLVPSPESNVGPDGIPILLRIDQQRVTLGHVNPDALPEGAKARGRPRPNQTPSATSRSRDTSDSDRGLNRVRRRGLQTLEDLEILQFNQVAHIATKGAKYADYFEDEDLENLFEDVAEAARDAVTHSRAREGTWHEHDLRQVLACLWRLLDEEHLSDEQVSGRAGETWKWIKTSRRHVKKMPELFQQIRDEYELMRLEVSDDAA